MTETMKKTNEAIARFKPPFTFSGSVIYDADGRAVITTIGGYPSERQEMAAELIKVLNFYYANQRERSERKGEKE